MAVLGMEASSTYQQVYDPTDSRLALPKSRSGTISGASKHLHVTEAYPVADEDHVSEVRIIES